MLQEKIEVWAQLPRGGIQKLGMEASLNKKKGRAIISDASKFLILGRGLVHKVGRAGARGQKEGEPEEVHLPLRFRVKGRTLSV